jgi:hypothetical protein
VCCSFVSANGTCRCLTVPSGVQVVITASILGQFHLNTMIREAAMCTSEEPTEMTFTLNMLTADAESMLQQIKPVLKTATVVQEPQAQVCPLFSLYDYLLQVLPWPHPKQLSACTLEVRCCRIQSSPTANVSPASQSARSAYLDPPYTSLSNCGRRSRHLSPHKTFMASQECPRQQVW